MAGLVHPDRRGAGAVESRRRCSMLPEGRIPQRCFVGHELIAHLIIVDKGCTIGTYGGQNHD